MPIPHHLVGNVNNPDVDGYHFAYLNHADGNALNKNHYEAVLSKRMFKHCAQQDKLRLSQEKGVTLVYFTPF
jgi:hypothetical protein